MVTLVHGNHLYTTYGQYSGAHIGDLASVGTSPHPFPAGRSAPGTRRRCHRETVTCGSPGSRRADDHTGESRAVLRDRRAVRVREAEPIPVCDLRYSERALLGDWLPIEPQSFSRVINGAGTFTGYLDLLPGCPVQNATNIAAVTPRKACLWCLQDGVPIWNGHPIRLDPPVRSAAATRLAGQHHGLDSRTPDHRH